MRLPQWRALGWLPDNCGAGFKFLIRQLRNMRPTTAEHALCSPLDNCGARFRFLTEQLRKCRPYPNMDGICRGPYGEAMLPATLDLVTHDDAQPTSPAVYLKGDNALTYGDLAKLVGEFERALRHDGKALVLCAGDRDLSTLLAYLAALRLGHAVAFLPASSEILSAYEPEFVVPAPGSGSGLD